MSNNSAKPRTLSSAGGALSNAATPQRQQVVLPTPHAARLRQLVLLEALQQLAAQQRLIVHAEDVSELPEIMAQRQLLIDELLVLDAACQAQANDAAQAGAAKLEFAQLEVRVRELAALVHEQDKADLAALQLRVQSVATELGELRSGGRALGAYASQGEARDQHQPLAQDTTA